MLQDEPVRLYRNVIILWNAIVAALATFDVITKDQVAAVLAVGLGVIGVMGEWIRSKVTPVKNLPADQPPPEPVVIDPEAAVLELDEPDKPVEGKP